MRATTGARRPEGWTSADAAGLAILPGLVCMDARWDNDVLNPAFHGLTADDFEVVELGWGASAAAP